MLRHTRAIKGWVPLTVAVALVFGVGACGSSGSSGSSETAPPSLADAVDGEPPGASPSDATTDGPTSGPTAGGNAPGEMPPGGSAAEPEDGDAGILAGGGMGHAHADEETAVHTERTGSTATEKLGATGPSAPSSGQPSEPSATPKPSASPAPEPTVPPAPKPTAPPVDATPAPKPTQTPVPPTEPARPVAPAPSYDLSTLPSLGFFDTTSTGADRAVRDDLSGALSGQVQLAQSHTIDAAGNAAKKMPTLVTDRAALLLFTPQTPARSVSVEVSLNGVVKRTIQLDDPTQIPRSDMKITGGREDVVYTRKAWTTQLPWDVMHQGLSLKFTTDTGETGVLGADGFEFAAPKELIISSIELGMLTDAPTSTDHYLLNEPEKAGSDYFQTIPVARMIVAKYETVELEKVIVKAGNLGVDNGTIYTTASTGTGGTYEGDLRENVGKAQVSTGINLANFGTSSSSMSQKQPGTFNQRIIHHSAGLYANGVHAHGLSGGNGMATLFSSRGNELSHELGHSYGLGHYPGTNNNATGDDKVIDASQHSESGWGYIAYRDRMRSNLAGDSTFVPEGFEVGAGRLLQNYRGIYNYNRDAMSGGWVTSTLSQYTHHTGYSAELIQRSLKTVVPDLKFPSGYRDWDAATGTYVDAKLVTPTFSSPRPSKVGVPVVTLLGGYSPSREANSLMYPAFRSNYGNVFTPAPDAVDTTQVSPSRQCWVSVSFRDGHDENTALLATDGVKQFNVNVDQADEPTGASIHCRTDGVTSQLGDAITIATDLAPMAPAVVIGEEQGYEALRAVEIVELDASLQKLVDAEVPVLPSAAAVQLSSWEDDLDGLSASSLAVVERIRAQRAAAAAVETFVRQNKEALAAGDALVKSALVDVLAANGMTESDAVVLPTGANLTVDVGRCLTVDDVGGRNRVVATDSSTTCADAQAQRWFMDLRGAIHNAALPGLCLTAATPATLTSCSQATASQVWSLESDGHLKSATSSYLDLYKHQTPATPGMYGRTNGINQLWKGLTTSRNPALVTLAPSTLDLLYSLDLTIP